ncbi:uncharacterized protein LOC26527821 [Drosophila mojavensis]|uniref:Uncharacterized protein n=1 Tax=Drosophila mojavensis TaxID=7230 RepID=A0A0Q9XDH6_DROMO|nr:uncharacterized protein LOC26527821 [Drosophila mojavensis]KRG02948.1 uncharacterized protein Dmoj_GI26180 [Drosophila mojavensis]
MAGFHTLVSIFIYLSFVLLFLVPNINGEAWCFNCEILAECEVHTNFKKFAKKVDKDKVVEKTGNDPANPNMDRCLKAGHTISGTISDTICSAGEDSMCHTIAEHTEDPLKIGMHCASCMILCGCPRRSHLRKDRRNEESALKEDAIVITICLAAFYMLM